jgi:hypothetical protein
MQSLTEQLLFHSLRERIMDESQLASIVGGSPARRYGLVNRALQAGELQRLMRGLYVLPQRFRQTRLHPFVIAQRLQPTSYISFETALAWHGWIPEAVYSTASVTSGRKTLEYQPEFFGHFSFHPLAIHTGYFLVQVERVELENQAALVARPLRALMDWICLHKQPWQGLAFLEDGLRIEIEQLQTVTGADIAALRRVYKHQHMQAFLAQFAQALGLSIGLNLSPSTLEGEGLG